MRVFILVAAVALQSCLCLCSEDGDVPLVRQQFGDKINNQIRHQITLELQASYLYKAYAAYFDRADIALPGFKKFFKKMSEEENEHAQILIDYINKRGGSVQFADVKLISVCEKLEELTKKIDLADRRQQTCLCYFMSQKRQKLKLDQSCIRPQSEWKHGLYAMEDSLVIERFVNSELLALHNASGNDPHLTHTLEHIYLDEQVESIKTFGDYVTQLRKFTDYTLGEYIFDQKLQS